MSRIDGHVLVTGGAGFIGSHLVRRLLADGARVTVLDNLSVGSRSQVPVDASLIVGDVRSRDDVEHGLQGVDYVFHLAAQVTIRQSFQRFYEDVDTNVMGTMNLLRCLDRQRVRHVTLASTMAVYADAPSPAPIDEGHSRAPLSPYGVSKWCTEQIAAQVLADSPTRLSVVRYFNTYGPGQAFTPYVGVVTIFATRLARGESITIFGDGQQARDFVHVDDIVDGTVRTIHGEPGTYNLGTGQATTVAQVAELVRHELQPEARIEYAPCQPGELRYSVANIDRARQGLGYAPQRVFARDVVPVLHAIRDRELCAC